MRLAVEKESGIMCNAGCTKLRVGTMFGGINVWSPSHQLHPPPGNVRPDASLDDGEVAARLHDQRLPGGGAGEEGEPPPKHQHRRLHLRHGKPLTDAGTRALPDGLESIHRCRLQGARYGCTYGCRAAFSSGRGRTPWGGRSASGPGGLGSGK